MNFLRVRYRFQDRLSTRFDWSVPPTFHVDDPPRARLEPLGARILRWIWPPLNRGRARAISQTNTLFYNIGAFGSARQTNDAICAMRKETHCLLAISRVVRRFDLPLPPLRGVDSSVATTPQSSATREWHSRTSPSIFRPLSSSSPWPSQPYVHPNHPRGPTSTT